jgi:hypothetical protein
VILIPVLKQDTPPCNRPDFTFICLPLRLSQKIVIAAMIF